MLLDTVAQAWESASSSESRNEQIWLLGDTLRSAEPPERPLIATYLSGNLRQTDLTIRQDQLSALNECVAASSPSLSMYDVDTLLNHVARVQGAGATARRSQLLRGVFERATRTEQRFLTALLSAEGAEGCPDSILLDAIGYGAGVALSPLHRAFMLTGDLSRITQCAFDHGDSGLLAFDLALFRPARPMTAQPKSDVADALRSLGRAALEYELPGERIQLHKQGSHIQIYSRALTNVTAHLPEIVELALSFPQEELIVDGSVIGLRSDGYPVPRAQVLRRFATPPDGERDASEPKLTARFFDCLYLDGHSLLELPAEARFHALVKAVPRTLMAPRMITEATDEATRFLGGALDAGYPGILIKSTSDAYAAGQRSPTWLRVRPSHTLNLVILAAEWGSGQRTGLLSNLHLGARDPKTGEFVMLGKTFKGLSEAMLREQTAQLVAREISRNAYTVFVRPELVVETAFSEIQPSPHAPAGLSLRLARVKRARPEKSAGEVDTIDDIRALYEKTTARREAARGVHQRTTAP